MTDFRLIHKKARELVTLMTGLREYKWWEADNLHLKLREDQLPAWINAVDALEELIDKTDDDGKEPVYIRRGK